MSKIVFKNTDVDALRELLKEIGGKNYWRLLEEQGKTFIDQKPMGIRGHYIEFDCDTQDLFLYYMYPGGTLVRIMSVNGYWRIPTEGWEMVKHDKEKR